MSPDLSDDPAQARARRQRHRAIAAYVVIGVALVAYQAVENVPRPAETPAAPVLFLERAVGGGIRAVDDSGPPAVGARVAPGAWLETPPDGRAALRTTRGGSLRVDADTRLRVLSASLMFLERGGLYFDGGAGAARAGMEVLTHWGRVRDLGTQYEVRTVRFGLEVRVREGRVLLLLAHSPPGSAARHEAQAGSALIGNPFEAVRSEIPTHGPGWRWVEETSPGFSIEGRSLESFLAWAARETGLETRFTSEALARSARQQTLHGSAAGLAPMQALEAVLPTIGLRLRRAGGVAWIEPSREAR
jgi:hypothetical protein